MANYVKFRRGSPAAFQSILDNQEAQSDTLYFIYEENETTGELYLGSKLISGNSTVNGATTLATLKDVLVNSNLSDTDCLVFDVTQDKWVNKPIADILPIFVGTIGETSGVAGLVPAPTKDQVNMFLRSDGQWSEIVTASNALVLQTIIGDNESHEDAIARIVAGYEINKGDIVILQEVIVGNLAQHISYVYNGTTWIAMDGNYSAENVYLSNDLTITADIGVQKLDGAGSKVLSTAGKNLKQVLDMLLASRMLPEITTAPSVSVSCPQSGSYEVGTTVTPEFSATFADGAYQYAPKEETGVSVSSWSAVFNGKTIDAQSGTFDPIVVTDNFSKRISVTATHSAGVAPEDNLGSVVTDAAELAQCQIQAGTKTGYSSYISGFRYQFYGSSVDAVDLTSENIRKLSKRNSSKSTLEMTIAEGANQVIIAVPASYTITKVADNGAFGTDILEKFVENTVSVAGATAGYDMDYKVYVYSPETALGANTYTVSLK